MRKTVKSRLTENTKLKQISVLNAIYYYYFFKKIKHMKSAFNIYVKSVYIYIYI